MPSGYLCAKFEIMKMNRTDIQIITGDITRIEADAIVNAANSSLLGGGGVDGAIHRAGGSVILDECRTIVSRQGGCKTGEAVVTTAGLLKANYVIHTVGPIWFDGNHQEPALLAACYANSLKRAIENGCKSIAFPNISTGVYRFPKALAAQVAHRAVNEFIAKTAAIEKITFVCYDSENYQLTQAIWAG